MTQTFKLKLNDTNNNQDVFAKHAVSSEIIRGHTGSRSECDQGWC